MHSSTKVSSVSLSAPYTVLNLAARRDTASQSCRCYGSPVLSSISKKSAASRKNSNGNTTEAVIAVDGEGINIVDVHSAKSISTYALPPNTKFSAEPISTRSSGANRRRTYAAISEPEPRIACWEENSARKSSSRSTFAISSPSSEYSTIDHSIEKHVRAATKNELISLLHIVHRKKSAPSAVTSASSSNGAVDSDVLVLYQNGLFECLSSDLGSLRWSSLPKRADENLRNSKILLATVISLKVAKLTILKNRSDVLFGYEPAPGDVAVLTLSTTTEKGSSSSNSSSSSSVYLDLYVVSNSSLVGNIRPLASVPLIVANEDTAQWNSSSLSYHALSGTLFHLTDTSLVTYDLCASLPKRSSTLLLSQAGGAKDVSPGDDSIIRISSSNVLVASAHSISLYNTKYGALHAQLNLDTSKDSIASIKKDSQSKRSLRFITFLHGAGVALAYNSEEIVALQITTTNGFTGNSLMDSICKGVGHGDSIPSYITRTKPDQTATPSGKLVGEDTSEQSRSLEKLALSNLEKLKRAAEKQNISRFEELFAQYVGLERNIQGLTAQQETWKVNGGGSDDFAELPEFIVTKAPPRALSQVYVASVLAVIFTVAEGQNNDEDGRNGKLQLSIFAPNVLKFLISEAYFSCSNLPNRGNGIIDALLEFDQDLNVLLFFLENAGATVFPLGEVVRAIQLILEKLVQPVQENIEDNASDTSSLSELEMEGVDNDDAVLQRAAASAERAIVRAQRLLKLNDTKESVLRAALIRVNKFPPFSVVKAFREGLGGNELVALIRILRRELLRDAEERTDSDLEDGMDEDGWMDLIADLLASCLDAAGVTGLLLAKDGVIKTASQVSDAAGLSADSAGVREELLLESLCSEVSDACEAMEGEHSLSILCNDLLNRAESFRLAGLVQRPHRQTKRNNKNGRGGGGFKEKPRTQQQQQQVQFFQSSTGGRGRAKDILPLGYPVPQIQTNKDTTMTPTELKRRRRMESRMKSMAVGDYTLERINI